MTVSIQGIGEMILVGGIPYSGKSYLCDAIISSNSRFVDCVLDRLVKEVETDDVKFFRYYEMMPCKVRDAIARAYPFIARQGDEDSQRRLSRIKAMLCDRKEQWVHVSNAVMMVYLTDKLLHLQANVPVIESILHTRQDRVQFYDTLGEWINILANGTDVEEGAPNPLDRVKKTFVYLDLGAERAARKARQHHGEKQYKYDEEQLRQIYRAQEIPVAKEFPNLEVIVVRNPNHFQDLVNRISS